MRIVCWCFCSQTFLIDLILVLLVLLFVVFAASMALFQMTIPFGMRLSYIANFFLSLFTN